jgi:hypothetical protein
MNSGETHHGSISPGNPSAGNARLVRAQGARIRFAARRRGTDRWRALVACLLLAVFLGFGLLLTGAVPSPTASTAALADRSGNALANAQVMFVSRSGDRCRQRAVDNATWVIRDRGEVDCDAPPPQPTDAVRSEGLPARMDVIREVFRRK